MPHHRSISGDQMPPPLGRKRRQMLGVSRGVVEENFEGELGVFVESTEFCFVIALDIVFYVFETGGSVVKQNWQYPN